MYDDFLRQYRCTIHSCGHSSRNQRGMHMHQRLIHADVLDDGHHQDAELPAGREDHLDDELHHTDAENEFDHSDEDSLHSAPSDRKEEGGGEVVSTEEENEGELLIVRGEEDEDEGAHGEEKLPNPDEELLLLDALDFAAMIDESVIAHHHEDEDDEELGTGEDDMRDYDGDEALGAAEHSQEGLLDNVDADNVLVYKDEDDDDVEDVINNILTSIGLKSEEELKFMQMHVSKGMSFETSQMYRNHMISEILFSDKTIIRKDVKNMFYAMQKRIVSHMLVVSEEQIEKGMFGRGLKLQTAVATFPNKDLATLLGLKNKSVTLEHVDWESLLKCMLADSLAITKKRGRDGNPKLPFCSSPSTTSAFDASDTNPHAYTDYYCGMLHFKTRSQLRRLHMLPLLEIFGLLIFIDGTQIASFKHRKVIPMYIATTLQPPEHRKIYHLGYIPVIDVSAKHVSNASRAAEVWRYWRTRVLDAILANFDPLNQSPDTFSITKSEVESEELIRIPLIPHIAAIVSDYVEGCDLAHFKSTASGIRPCRGCRVRKGKLYDTATAYPRRDCARRALLWSGSSVPVTLAEYKARENSARSAIGEVGHAGSIATGFGGGIDESKATEFEERRARVEELVTNFEISFILQLGTVTRLKEACSARGIRISSNMKKRDLQDALRRQKLVECLLAEVHSSRYNCLLIHGQIILTYALLINSGFACR